MIAHIVFFQPRPGVSAETKRAFALKLAEARRGIPAIRRGVVGRSVNVDAGYERDFGDSTYDYAAILEFEDAEGLRSYLRHPLHEEIGRLFWETCERTTILEVDARELDDECLGDFLGR